MTMKAKILPSRFRLRQGHKEYLLHAAQSSSHSASELVRKSLAEMLDSNWSAWDANCHVAEERDALDGCEMPKSTFRYRETPWSGVTVQLQPALLDAVRNEALRLSVGRDALVRAALFQFLTYHYELPPDQRQFPSEQELGYSTLTAPDGWPVDPRHPANLRSQRLAEIVASIELTRFAQLLEEDPEGIQCVGAPIRRVHHRICGVHPRA